MIKVTCPLCAAEHSWSWEEAFDKFGFDDGDGIVMTDAVANVLRANGYTVKIWTWGMHNTIIDSIRKNNVSVIPKDAKIGYDDPRKYLPNYVIELLDAADFAAE